MTEVVAYRPPYDWAHVIAFLAARATPGVECVDANSYSRTIAIGGARGTVTIRPTDGHALALDIDVERSPTASIVERVSRMFDVAADPQLIAAHLSGDPLLRPTLAMHPGIRTPGAWDPFELTVRAILGQQISVKAATTIAGRVAARWGTPIEATTRLTRLFPTPDQLRDAPLEEAGITSARATTLRALAQAVSDGALTFDAASSAATLQSIKGIGEWTAQYVAMRAFNDPDAFLTGDLVLRRMAGDCSAKDLTRKADAWRPWRAYAVMLLWQAARDRDQSSTGRASTVRTNIDACA